MMFEPHLAERDLDLIAVLKDEHLRQWIRVRNARGQSFIARFLWPELAGKVQQRRLHREFELQRQARGPHVREAIDLLVWPNTLAILMEDFPGRPLLESVQEQAPDLRTCLFLASEMAAGLDRMHDLNIVHRNIGPGGILWHCTSNEVRIDNFACARSMQEEQPVDGELEGSLPALAPEQSGRLRRVADTQADLYSLGVLLYWLLAGRWPFQADDALGRVHAHLALIPPPLHAVTSGVPKVVSRIGQGSRPYGREAPLQLLADALAAVRRQGHRTVMVSGYSGIGKTVLVAELFRTSPLNGGQQISGKVDQFQRKLPYLALIQALDALAARLPDDPLRSAAEWSNEITQAVGDNPVAGPASRHNARGFAGGACRPGRPVTLLSCSPSLSAILRGRRSAPGDLHRRLAMGQSRNAPGNRADSGGRRPRSRAADRRLPRQRGRCQGANMNPRMDAPASAAGVVFDENALVVRV